MNPQMALSSDMNDIEAPHSRMVSPFSNADHLMNSFGGLVAFVGIDHFADKALIHNIEETGKATFENGKYTFGPGGGNIGSAIERRYGEHLVGGHGRYGANSKWARRFVRAERNQDPGWLLKATRFFIKSPEEKARTLTARQVSGQVLRGEIAAEPALVESLKFGSRMHGLGIAAMSVGLASIGFEAGSGIATGLSSKGRRDRGISRNAMQAQTFMDTRMAYTSRQRALQAIQLSQGSYRRALGNEASYIKSAS